MEPAPRNSPRLEVLAVPQSCMSVPLEPWDSHSRRGWSCTWDLRYLLRTQRIQVQIVKVRLKSIPGFQDSRIRDYQWLPCHTVSIRNPQISRTRFVVDCSAFLPALGWLVAFCAAKAWRTNARSLRSLGTQSRKDRKRVLSSTECLFSGASRRCATVRHGRICFESVSNLLPFEDFVSFSGSFFLCEFFCCFGSDLESQSNLLTSIKSNQVYQFIKSIKFHRPVMRCEMCWVPCVTSKDSSIRFLMSRDATPWTAMISHDSRESLDYRLPQLDFCPWVSAINRSARVQSMEKCPCQLRGVGWWCCQIYQAAAVQWRCAARLSLNRLKSLIHIFDPLSQHVSSKTTQQDSSRTIKDFVQLSTNQLVFKSTKVF